MFKRPSQSTKASCGLASEVPESNLNYIVFSESSHKISHFKGGLQFLSMGRVNKDFFIHPTAKCLSQDFLKYLFIHERCRGKDTHRGRSRLPEGSLMQDSIPGPLSGPEPKADAQPLSNPGAPPLRFFIKN